MFELQWANRDAWVRQPSLSPAAPSALSRDAVASTLHLAWSEHCVECAIPDCYSSCPLYSARTDGACARFAYGIYPNRSFGGHFDFGADVLFRRWAKLEAAIGFRTMPVPVTPHALLEGVARLPLWVRNRASRIVSRAVDTTFDFDAFVLECFSPSPDPFNLILTYTTYEGDTPTTVFRHAFRIEPGANFFSIPFEQFQLGPTGFLSLSPEESAGERRLIFTWLDFVTHKGAATRAVSTVAAQPAPTVKCVAWDLDNTLWAGTLVESAAPAALTLRPGILAVIEALDERGIIQTVVSRNDHDEAWAQLERLSIAEYFVYPAINWGQKSENLRRVAERININLDACAFVDDSPLQRSEVQAALPQVRVYADSEIDGLLTRPEFDVPVTAATKGRRHSYLASMRREAVQASFSGGYEDFLRQSDIRLRVFTPVEDEAVDRCWELVQRTSQLNLSGRRYSRDEFARMLRTQLSGLAIEYADRFGAYGVVGFATLDLAASPPALVDFVLSCRVAQQRVEHMFLKWLAGHLAARGADTLAMTLTKTSRNSPLRQVFADLAFNVHDDSRQQSRMTWDLAKAQAIDDVATVDADVSLLGR